MFLSDENDNNDSDGSGSFFFLHCIAPQLHVSLTTKVRVQAEQQPWSWYSPAQRHLRKANACYRITHSLNNCFPARIRFCCPLASRLSAEILHLIGVMKEIINLWMNIWGKSKHLFLICSDKTFPPGVNISSRNPQNKTTSHLIICHNYAAHCDERISMIYLCHRKRVQLQTWKLLKPMRVSSQWMIKGAKAYQRCSLTLKQCHMAVDILPQWQYFCTWT